MGAQTAILLQCYQQAAQASTGALERCIDKSVSVIQEAETKAAKGGGREELGQAWRELQTRKSEWCGRFPRDLSAAFSAAASAALSEGAIDKLQAQAGAAKPKEFTLSLADDTQLADAIEGTRLLQSVLPVVDQPLSEVNARISTALGFPSVLPELNPLRPEIFTRTLRTLMSGAGLAPAVTSLAMKHMANPLGQELKAIYVEVAALLERAGMQLAEYRVLLTPGGPGFDDDKAKAGADEEAVKSKNSAADSKGDGEGEGKAEAGAGGKGTDGKGTDAPAISQEQYANLSKLQNSEAIIRDFLARGQHLTPQPLAPTYYAAVDKEMAEVRAMPEPEHAEPPEPPPEYRQTPVVERPARLVDQLSQLSSKVWGAYGRAKERALVHVGLKKEAKNTAQVIGLEVVRKVVSKVAQDPRLLGPVREAIIALEPSALRLAMVDPRFLTDEAHAGRRLIEAVAQRSFRYNDEFAEDFQAFFLPITETFNVLNGMSVASPKPFEAALNGLEGLWNQQDAQESEKSQVVLESLGVAETRQALADQIAQELSLRSDIEGAPAVALDFIYGPWTLVMADARMLNKNRQIDPGAYGAVITDLLWSSKSELTMKEPAKLMALIPAMLGKLREGLGSLGQTQNESDAFFDALMKLHQPVLMRRLRRVSAAAGETPLPALPPTIAASAERRKPKVAEMPWLGPQQRDAAGFSETGLESPSQIMATDEANAAGESAARASAVLAGLDKGSKVDVVVNEQWLRAQLIWTSTKRTMFMFTSQGGRPHSMTARNCVKLIADNLLRPVATHQVVAQALDDLKKT